MSANLLYSNDAMKWRRSIRQLEGASFFMSWKIGSEYKVDCRLVDRGCWWLRNEDACLHADD